MTRGIARPSSRFRRWVPLLATACLALIAPGSARADLVIAAENVTVNAGTTGDSLDVTLTNTGPGAVGIGGFTFELTVGSSEITFTDVTTSTVLAPYIFDGLGLFGPSIGNVVTGQDIQASDAFSVIGSGTTLGAGATVGLGHLVFDVSASATGVNPVLIAAFPATSLSDFNGNDVPITRLIDGSITVRGVPEPASLGLVGLGVALAALRYRGMRRRSQQERSEK